VAEDHELANRTPSERRTKPCMNQLDETVPRQFLATKLEAAIQLLSIVQELERRILDTVIFWCVVC
jgi:hypothetical protein